MATVNTSQTAENPPAAIIHPTISIPLNKLVPWAGNVRRTRDKAALERLKASILAHGLLQSPVVTEADDGMYHVVAGERRRIVLLELQKEGKLPDDYHVTCQKSDGVNGREVSLAENVEREAMHPADEFEAYNRLATEDKIPSSKIAERFGVTEKHVLQRLKLARVHPQLVKEYRAEKLSLECLMSFTITDDRARQLKVFKGLKGWQQNDARHIKACLTEKTLSGTHPLVKFVGLDAYKEAGGTVREDFFGDEVFLEKPALIEQLATVRFDAAISELKKEGWAWVEQTPEDYTYRYQCSRIAAKKGGKFDSEEMKLAGCFVSVSREGKLDVDRGVVKPQDKRKLAKSNNKDVKGKVAPEEKGLSQSLLLSLKSFRLQVAQLALASKPELAYELLVFTAARSLLGDASRAGGLDIRFFNKTPVTTEVKDTPASKALAQMRDKLALKWLSLGNDAERFEEFRKLTAAQKASVLAFCVALTLEPSLAPDAKGVKAQDIALALSGVDVASYWRPTAENFLGRITRGQLIELGSGILGKLWSARRGSGKKGDLAKELDQAFADPKKHGTDKAVQDRLRTWLPDGMAFTLPEKAPAKAKKKAA